MSCPEARRESSSAAAAPHARRLSRRGLLLGAAAASVLSLGRLGAAPIPAPAVPAPTSPDAFLAFFDKLALRSRRADGGDVPGWVRKWTGPVEVRVFGAETRRARLALVGALHVISRTTGLVFRIAPFNRGDARRRLDIHYLDHEEMVARYDGAIGNCATWGNGGRLHTGLIEISARYADCLHHELMHGLGFDNHWTGALATGALPSVLANRGTPARAKAFSVYDLAAIRLLYDPRLEPGTHRDHALPLARALVVGARLA